MTSLFKHTIPSFAAALLLMAGVTVAPVLAAPRVVASVLPVHSLVAAVMAGVGKPDLLIPAAVSPHAYALRPADARLLARAQAVFWVGDSFETFLRKPLEALAGEARVVSLMRAPGLNPLETRPAAAWALVPDADDADDEDDEEADHERAGSVDSHAWLDPRNAAAMVRQIARTLSEIDPPNAARYAANAEATLARLDALDRNLEAGLAPLAGRPYVVFHDAYQYLEARYGLTPVGAVTLHPDRPAGARHVQALRKAIRESGATCAFREPQLAPALLGTLVEGTAVEITVLDPLGSDLQPGPDAYFELMRSLADSLATCLNR